MLAEYLIAKKKGGLELSVNELRDFFSDWLSGRLTDAGMTEMLRAMQRKGLTFAEMVGLMHLLLLSDEVMDLTAVPGTKVELHSLDGAGERVSLAACALVAAVGVPVVQLSGPGIGYAISPLDKLQAVPGFQGKLDREAMLYHARRQRYVVAETPPRLAPAAARLYKLCEAAGLLSPVPFFAPLEMAHVLSGGADAILLDIPFGEDCLVQTVHEAVLLARTMCALGEAEGRKMAAVVSKAGVAVGTCVGSVEEFAEAVEVLEGEGDPDFTELALDLAARLLYLGGRGSLSVCRMRAERAAQNGAAADKLLDMAEEQGADPACLDELSLLPQPNFRHTVRARRSGYVAQLEVAKLQQAALQLKAARVLPTDEVDSAAGIVLQHRYGDFVRKGEELAILGAAERGHFSEPAAQVRSAFRLSMTPPPPLQYLYAWICGSEVELLMPPEAPQPEPSEKFKDNVIIADFSRGKRN